MIDIRSQNAETEEDREHDVRRRKWWDWIFFLPVAEAEPIFTERSVVLCFTCYLLSLTYMPLVGSQDLRAVLVGLLLVLSGFQYLNEHLRYRHICHCLCQPLSTCSFRQKGSIALSLSIVNWVGENQRIGWDGQAVVDTIQFFISGLGLKTLSCSLFNLLDLDLEVL
jgi:hypothetical protein